MGTALQVVVGGFSLHVAGLRVSSHSAARPLAILLLAAAVLWLRFDHGAIRADLSGLDAMLERSARGLAATASVATLVVGLWWGTWAAGGSDSYCYIGQAEEFAAGRAILREPLAREVSLPGADLVFAPVGFIPAAHGGGAAPMCAPGLSLVMAAMWRVGGPAAIHLVVPILGALAVWGTFLLGRMMHGAVAGACAAVLLAASPVFLYQVVQPMSDVPAAAFWTAVLVMIGRGDAPGQIVGGLMASLALLTRPNLAPALIPITAFVVLRPYQAAAPAPPVSRLRALLWFSLALIPGCALLVWLNHLRYASPFRTGYGDVETLFSVAHVSPNALRYSTWVTDAQTPLIALALAAPFVVRRREPWVPAARFLRGGVEEPGVPAGRFLRGGVEETGYGSAPTAFMWMAVGFVAIVVGCYLPYKVFDAWWYTRFLLPALPVALALTAASLVALASRIPARGAILVVTICALVVSYVTFARSHEAFALRDFERRYITAGTYVGRALPENAVVITIQESGAVRHYGHRPAALWDALAPDALDETVALLQRAGRAPYFLLEDWEEQGFRERFAGERFGALDWPPSAEIRERVTVRLYDPRDRSR